MRKKRKIAVTFAAGALVAGAGVLATATPAAAHEQCGYLNYGRGHACVYNPHHWIAVCDDKADNWGVRVYVDTNYGPRFANDGNGSASGCGGYHTAYPDEFIRSFVVCAGENGRDTDCTGRFTA